MSLAKFSPDEKKLKISLRRWEGEGCLGCLICFKLL